MKQAKNAVERHVIWSDIHLDLDDWRDFLMENYPELPEDKLYEKMHELNAEYLDDERRNVLPDDRSSFRMAQQTIRHLPAESEPVRQDETHKKPKTVDRTAFRLSALH